MIDGAHAVIFSKHPEADREFFRNVLALTSIDVGGGWLIFGLPPAAASSASTSPDTRGRRP